MKAVVLLSGGLDSSTVLAIASQQYSCHALSFNYGQRSRSELQAAKNIAQAFQVVEHKVVDIDLSQFGGSALTDSRIDVPDQTEEGIPLTYVPARNTVFLSMALAYAEVIAAADIFIGVNAVDYSGYPDCRPQFIASFQQTANLATKAGIEGQRITIHTPLMDWSKADIIRQGLELGVDYSLTVSCYQADTDGKACGRCDACRFRKNGFNENGSEDPTRYQ